MMSPILTFAVLSEGKGDITNSFVILFPVQSEVQLLELILSTRSGEPYIVSIQTLSHVNLEIGTERHCPTINYTLLQSPIGKTHGHSGSVFLEL